MVCGSQVVCDRCGAVRWGDTCVRLSNGMEQMECDSQVRCDRRGTIRWGDTCVILSNGMEQMECDSKVRCPALYFSVEKTFICS